MAISEGAYSFLARIFDKKPKGSTPFRRDKAPDEPPASPCVLTAPDRALYPGTDPVSRAAEGQDKRRNLLYAERLAKEHLARVRGGHYAYRVLKSDFDALCALYNLAPVSDKFFAKWLAAAGGERYRCNYPKTTMYKMPRKRRSARADKAVEMRC